MQIRPNSKAEVTKNCERLFVESFRVGAFRMRNHIDIHQQLSGYDQVVTLLLREHFDKNERVECEKDYPG